MAADLHCHTKISDGSVGIEEIIAMAKRRGLSAISITDHDTTAGAIRAVIIGKRHQLNVIHGVEFSAFDSQTNKKVHLLCYASDTPDRLEGLCRKVGESRKSLDGNGQKCHAVLPHFSRYDCQVCYRQHKYI